MFECVCLVLVYARVCVCECVLIVVHEEMHVRSRVHTCASVYQKLVCCFPLTCGSCAMILTYVMRLFMSEGT